MTIISTLPYTLTNGSTADATQVMADFNQIVNNVNANAAANGANSDITSLTGLSTPLSISQGGSGTTTATGTGELVLATSPALAGTPTAPTASVQDNSTKIATTAYADRQWTTGDVKLTLKTVADTGWVLMNDGTIGDASSGGTTRANADTSALFTLLWTNTADADCPVSGGRGASAAADFAAHKTITLPASLGRALAVYGSGSGLTSRALGSHTGAETHQIAQNELPNVTVNYDKPNATSNTVGQGTGLINNAGQGFTSTPTSSINGGVTQQNMTIMQPSTFLNAMIKL